MNSAMTTSSERFVMCLLMASIAGACTGCGSAATQSDSESAVPEAAVVTGAAASAPVSFPGDGEWHAVSATLAGAPFPEEVTRSISLSITGERYEVNVGGTADSGTCAIDQTTAPIRLTITGTEGPNAGQTMFAICDFPETDRMRVCYRMSGTDFPGVFESTTENGLFLAVYQRKESSAAGE